MARSFSDYTAELVGAARRLPPSLAQLHVNRAWRDIREYRLWTFNVGEASVVIPAAVTSGTVSTTQFSSSVVGDSTAGAAWAALSLPLITQRQFRVATGPVYNIVAFDGVSALTLDRLYGEATASAQAYSIFRSYFPAPSSSFLRWESFVDPVNAFTLRSERSHSDFDRWDPQRAAVGLPYYVGSYKPVTIVAPAGDPLAGQSVTFPQFELWPQPNTAVAYLTLYVTRGSDFVLPGDMLPPAIPEDLLVNRALYYAYQWCEANKGAFADLQASNWLPLAREANGAYFDLLRRTARQDEETFQTQYSRFYPSAGGYGVFLSADWLQVHDGCGIFD